MGTGSGAVGIDAARRGAIVTACDVNPRAVRLTSWNAGRNAVAIEVLQSDLFAAIPERQFDVICFNLPFYARDPETPFGHALYGGRNLETVRAFAAGCRQALAPTGSIIVVFSEDSDRERILKLFAGADLVPTEERTALRNFERFHLVRLGMAPAVTASS
jgi:release factor glutamine methyltransferase